MSGSKRFFLFALLVGLGLAHAQADRSGVRPLESRAVPQCKTQPATPSGGLRRGTKLHVLWVGNSLTDTPPELNNYSLGPMPARLAPLLAELGITLSFEAIIKGGANFSDHVASGLVEKKLASARFDAVNLQGYYEGFQSGARYVKAVGPLHEAVSRHGAVSMFEVVWSFVNDPGSPQFPAALQAVEQAARELPGAMPVPVSSVWQALRKNASLYARLQVDPTHQSVVGEYLNTLAYARFFSGQSVRDLRYIHPAAARQLSEDERLEMKEAVDANVRTFFQPFEVLVKACSP